MLVKDWGEYLQEKYLMGMVQLPIAVHDGL